jgi:glycosyltransferase involved in cell wall biosynthesis
VASILWASADPVAEGNPGVTDRIEGVRYLLEQGHDVHLVCGAGPEHRPVPGIPSTFLPTRYVPFAGWVWLWPRLLGELRSRGAGADAIVTDFALLPPILWWRNRRRRAGEAAPAIVLDVRTPPVEAGSLRTWVQRRRFAATLRLFARRTDAVTAITDGLRDEVARLARSDARTIPVWGSGCSWCDRPAPTSPAGPRPRELEGRFVVIYHGSISRGRGLIEAVEALPIVAAEAPDLTLALLGSRSALGELRRLAARLGVQDRVVFLDPVPHDRVREVLECADIGLVPLPRKWEWELSSPLKLVEYLCAGLPVALTDISAHRIVPPDAQFAFWAPSADPEALASALLTAYRRRAQLPELGRQAALWARPRLGWAPQLAVLERTIRAAVEGRGRVRAPGSGAVDPAGVTP